MLTLQNSMPRAETVLSSIHHNSYSIMIISLVVVVIVVVVDFRFIVVVDFCFIVSVDFFRRNLDQ